MPDDTELLRRYAFDRSEAAFAELVRRHLAFVYAAALRQVGGDDSLAQEATQIVFADLARKAARLAAHRVLIGWLFTSTRFTAAKIVRSERRRRAREQEAHTMQELNQEPVADADWAKLRPVIDDVLESLGRSDREAVLLRFFEGQAFAEIGAKFEITGDAARLRIERALEKMRAGLARHGVKSTPAALALALANQPAVALPAALASTVTVTALAGAAVGSGLTSALGLSTFMSTTKLGVWSVAALALLASLAGNAYLLTATPATAHPQSTAALPSTANSAASAGNAAVGTLALVRDADLTALRDRLRSIGTNEASIRVLLEGLLRRRYREKLSADRIERQRRGWWRDPQWNLSSIDYPIQFREDQRLLREMVTKPLEQLLGPDPLAVAEANARYAFLPPELRQAFGRLDRTTPPSFIASGDLSADGVIEGDLARQRQTTDDERKALVDSLTPEQRANWDLHNSSLATNLSRQLGPVDATEAEYRAIFPLAQRFAEERDAKRPEGTDLMAVQNDLRQQVMQQLMTALGYDRALDVIWSGAMEYGPYARVARDANLPASTAGKVMELAAEAAREAATIHSDTTLSLEQKRTALVALQQSVQPALDGLVPPAVQQRLSPNAQIWLTGLSNGSYKTIVASLPGQFGVMFSRPQSVDQPSSYSPKSMQPLPPRPAAK